MQLSLKPAQKSDEAKARDRIYAAMETGNHGQARKLLLEMKQQNGVLYNSVRMDVLHEYGMAV